MEETPNRLLMSCGVLFAVGTLLICAGSALAVALLALIPSV